MSEDNSTINKAFGVVAAPDSALAKELDALVKEARARKIGDLMKVGDVLRTKVSAEQVVVVGFDKANGYVQVRRAVQTRNEGVQYVDSAFSPFELESTSDSIQREFDEMCLKNKMMSQYLKSEKQLDLEAAFEKEPPTIQ